MIMKTKINRRVRKEMDEQDQVFLNSLISRIKEEPSLYKVDDHNYSNDNVRHKAFLRVQEKMREDGVAPEIASVITIRDKFRILKRRFASEHKRKGGESTWPFYEHLSFLIPCVEHSQLQEIEKNGEGGKRKNSSAKQIKMEPPEKKPSPVYSSPSPANRPPLPIPNDFSKDIERIEFNRALTLWIAKHPNCGVKTKAQYDDIVHALMMKHNESPFTAIQKRDYETYCEKYDLQFDDDNNPQIFYRGKRVVHEDELFDILYGLHQQTSHARRDVMFKNLIQLYDGVSKNIVLMYLKTCRYCEVNGIGVSYKDKQNQLSESNFDSSEFDESTVNTLSIFLKACESEMQSERNTPGEKEMSYESAQSASVEAYILRQTYIFFKTIVGNKKVMCRLDDEDFFPPSRVFTTPSERSRWQPGEIVIAYFGFDQIPAECIVESLGDREKVQEEFINSHLIQDSQNSNSSIPVDVSNHVNNGGKSNGNDRKKSSPSTELCAETTLSMNMNNIQQRFEEMEERLRFLEQQVLTSPLANAENFEKNLFGSINN